MAKSDTLQILRLTALRQLARMALLFLCVPLVASPIVRPVTPETIPEHIQVEFSTPGCDSVKIVRNPRLVWYATVKAPVESVEVQDTSVQVLLKNRDPYETLLSPGGQALVENGFLLRSIAFSPKVIDSVLFEWRENQVIYQIWLSDFFTGDRCWEDPDSVGKESPVAIG